MNLNISFQHPEFITFRDFVKHNVKFIHWNVLLLNPVAVLFIKESLQKMYINDSNHEFMNFVNEYIDNEIFEDLDDISIDEDIDNDLFVKEASTYWVDINNEYRQVSFDLTSIDIIGRVSDHINYDISMMEPVEQEKSIMWMNLSLKSHDPELLKRNLDKLNWFKLGANPVIFTYDYERICNERQAINEEAMAEVYRPKRIQKWIEDGNDIDDYLQ